MSTERTTDTRVSTLELFFDLVFVFTVTQLTQVLVHDALDPGLLRVVLMLGVIFWMYGGYAWLTNAVPMDTGVRRALLLVGMAGYLVLALAIPHAFTEQRDGIAFGAAYLVIVLVHGGLFATVLGAGTCSIGLTNLLTGALVLAGGIAGGDAQVALWAAAFLGEWLTPVVTGVEGFPIDPSHFVERHGLVVIVAIGESIVAIGIGASELELDAEVAGLAVLGLLLNACLWWTYFAQDDRRAEAAMRAATPARRGLMAVRGFGYCHLLLLLGIIGIAAGLEEAIAHPFEALAADPASFMAAGASAYLLGDVLFRRTLGLAASGPWRLGAALVLLAAIPVGTEGSGLAELVLLVVVFGGALVAEATLSPAASPR